MSRIAATISPAGSLNAYRRRLTGAGAPSARNREPAMRERITAAIYDRLKAMGAPETTARGAQNLVSDASGFMPVIGTGFDIDELRADLAEGDYRGAAGTGIGLAAGAIIPGANKGRKLVTEAIAKKRAPRKPKVPVAQAPDTLPYTETTLPSQGAVGEGSRNLGPARLQGAEGASIDTISSRYPTGAKRPVDPTKVYLQPSTAAMREAENTWEPNIDLLRRYPQLPREVVMDGNADDVAKAYTDQMTDNLLWLHDQVPSGTRQNSKLWYDGANRLANDRARMYGVQPSAMSGVYAALSPQKDWYQNVSLGDRVADIMSNQRRRPFTNQMAETAQRIFGKQEYADDLGRVMRSSLEDLEDPTHRAMWLRIYDETYNPREYAVVGPDGSFLKPAAKKDGGAASAAWGSNVEIAKAIQAFESGGDPTALAKLMGERHKVRSFYNNIVDPQSHLGDVTIDTHAIAAGQLRPLSGNTVPVAHNFGNSLKVEHHEPGEPYIGAKGSAITGSQGTYGIAADAYRRAAEQRGILPREMQSITWEAVRGLFQDTWKTKENLAKVDAIWRAFQDGQIDIHQVRRNVHDIAGGIAPPTWEQRVQ